jgi:hypothetical protein
VINDAPTFSGELMRTLRRAIVAAVLGASLAAPVDAQLPTVQQVYDKFAKAVGGRDAWAKVTDRAEKGTANFEFAGLSGSYERYYSAPNKFRLVIDLGVGKVEQGSNGAVAWTSQPGVGAKRMATEDSAYVLESSATGSAFLDPSRFAKVAVIAQESFDGVPCIKVALTTKSGRSRVDYFEVASGLRRGFVLTTADGEQKTVFQEYKAFEGKMVATKFVQSNPQGNAIFTIASVTFTANNASLFDLPPGVAK